MKARMRLGDLLIQAKLVTAAQVAKALELQAEIGGRLGERLVGIEAITREVLDSFIHRMPTEPHDLAATGIDPTELLSLMMKLIYVEHLESARQFVDSIKLPYNLVLDLIRMAIDRQLLRNLGTRDSGNPLDLSYAFTDEGRRYTVNALEQMRYTGPAPVTLDEFCNQVNLQKITNERVTFDRLRKSFGELVFEDSIVEHIGPAMARPLSRSALPVYSPM
jgi:hypothetical protein